MACAHITPQSDPDPVAQPFPDRHYPAGKIDIRFRAVHQHHIVGFNQPQLSIGQIYAVGQSFLMPEQNANVFHDILAFRVWSVRPSTFTSKLNALNPLFNALDAVKVAPNRTKKARIELGLGKEHWADAAALVYAAFGVRPGVGELPHLLLGRFVRTKNRQLHRANPSKGGKRAKAQGNRYLINRSGIRVMRNDLVKCVAKGVEIVGYVNTLRSSGSVRIANWQGKELANISVNKVKKLQNCNSIVWEVS